MPEENRSPWSKKFENRCDRRRTDTVPLHTPMPHTTQAVSVIGNVVV